MNDEEAEYEVENITQARVEKEGRKKNLIWKYNVRWKGYGPEDDTWEPVASFVGSEDMIEQFWQRANSGGRDYRVLSLFKAGEEFVLTGPPRRKPKRQSLVSNAKASADPSSSRISEPSSSKKNKRRRSPSIVEIKDSEDEDRVTKRPREDKETREPLPKESIPLPGRGRKKGRKSPLQTSSPANTRIFPKKLNRAPSFDEIIPASDDELAQMYDEPLEATWRKSGVDADQLNDISATEDHIPDAAMDRDASPMPVDSHPKPDSATLSSNLPAHRAKAANPKVKMAKLDFTAQEGALAVKARLHGQGSALSASAAGSPRVKSGPGSKPGPGRSSSGFMTKNTSSLLTFEKGELKTVKGRYRKEDNKDGQPSSADPLWGGDDEIEDNNHFDLLANTAPPTANELLHLAGADHTNEPLPDFEDDAPDVAPMIAESPPSTVIVPVAEAEPQPGPVHRESVERAKDNLFPSSASTTFKAHVSLWKQPTMFGPFSTSIPVILTDIAPSQPGSPSLELIVANKGPPGVFYDKKSALALLDTVRTGGPSAKIGLHASATPDHKSLFERFCFRLSAGELV
ncbi:hypothetical protein C0991_003901 [Blastosporella zonata]|nr:hypothetical protein C0991_003901 [Blastosporella zonata]